MAGRGRARGRSRGVLDAESLSPGGLRDDGEVTDELVAKGGAEVNSTPTVSTPTVSTPTVSTPTVSTPTVSTPTVSTPTVSTPTVSTPTVSTPTLSLDDIKSILEDSRTYSEQNDVKKVLMCAQNFVRTEQDVKTLAWLIYKKCTEDSSLAKRGVEICDSLSSIEVGSTKFRNCLLSLVQGDYIGRNKLLASKPCQYNGFLAFMCEAFNVMRTTNNEVFKPLVPAIFDCLNLILGKEARDGEGKEVGPGGDGADVDEDACDVFAIQLQSMGRLLEQNGEELMRELMDHIRTCVINSKSSPRVRCSLLEILEANARRWEPAHNDTTKFYCDMAVDIISGLVL